MEAEVWKTIGKKGGADGWEEWEPSKKLPIQRGGWSKFFSQQSTNCHASNTQAGRVIIFHIFFLVERQQKNGVSPIFFDGWSSPTEFEQKKRCAFFCFYHEGLVNNSRGVKKGPRPDVFRQILFSAQWSHSESLEALLRFEVGVFEMKPLTKRNISVEAQPTCVYTERQRT